MNIYGVDTLVRIISHLFFISLSFWTLQSLRLDMLFKKGIQYERQIKMFYCLLAVVIGFAVSNFFLEIIYLMRTLIQGAI
ncbi:DUF1146 family protein [Vagococcus sp.]|uniref:DUF1146 family protein n=1 Tax=Vagococcus sp. TaxID=1933889 RepID=UPI003F9D0AB6